MLFVCLYMYVCGHMDVKAHVWRTLLSYGFLVLYSYSQAWQQVALPTEPYIFLKKDYGFFFPIYLFKVMFQISLHNSRTLYDIFVSP